MRGARPTRRHITYAGLKALGEKIYILQADPRGGWRVNRENDRLGVLRGVKKTDLVARARRLARSEGARLLIHRRDGSLEEEWIYPA